MFYKYLTKAKIPAYTRFYLEIPAYTRLRLPCLRQGPLGLFIGLCYGSFLSTAYGGRTPNPQTIARLYPPTAGINPVRAA